MLSVHKASLSYSYQDTQLKRRQLVSELFLNRSALAEASSRTDSALLAEDSVKAVQIHTKPAPVAQRLYHSSWTRPVKGHKRSAPELGIVLTLSRR